MTGGKRWRGCGWPDKARIRTATHSVLRGVLSLHVMCSAQPVASRRDDPDRKWAEGGGCGPPQQNHMISVSPTWNSFLCEVHPPEHFFFTRACMMVCGRGREWDVWDGRRDLL